MFDQGKPFPLKVFDVGMNFGAFTLFASSLKCEVWGFEMQPHIFTLVDMSLRISGYRYEDAVHAFTYSLPNGCGRSWTHIHNTAVFHVTNRTLSFDSFHINFGQTVLERSSKLNRKVFSDSHSFPCCKRME